MTPARHYTKAAYRAAMRLVGLAPAERNSATIKALMGDWHHGAAPTMRGYTLQMTAFSAFHSLPWLHRVAQPTLVVSGTHDNLMPIANSAVLAAYLPHARLHVVPGWGHYLLFDPASRAPAAVAEFFAAPDHAASRAWRNARTVAREDLPRFVKAAPRSANPASFTNGVVRSLFPPRTGAR
jgi:pimeloyl-ACP methyl ester carboxylesterase